MRKILIIEDDTALRENTAELLELADFNVITAANGRIGIELAKKNNPDVIVCDIMMPEIDGYGVLEALSLDIETNQIPFIFLSARTDHKEVRKGMDLGADDYLTKPFEEDELLKAIETRLAKAEVFKTLLNNAPQISNDEDQLRNLNELKNFFDDNGEELSFKKGEIIYQEGTRSFRIYLITKGVVKTFQIDKSGKELITSLFKEDEFLGFTSILDNVAYEESAEALENVNLVGVSKSVLKDVLDNNNNLSMELLQLLSHNVANVKTQLLQMAYSSVRKKTAQTILQFASVYNKHAQEDICITRNDLASVAGIATESLIRTLSGFKKEGLIEIEGRSIRIIDLDGLEKVE
ncbi:two-component response regulator [Nonlabens ulvanivorans]|nr:response regulator [Nonlabens ulvanivorans]GAK91309.1 two-component response regulator [Nonlabens ulvanivorans]